MNEVVPNKGKKIWIVSFLLITIFVVTGSWGIQAYKLHADKTHVTTMYIQLLQLTYELEAQLKNEHEPLKVNFSKLKNHPYYLSHSLSESGAISVQLSLHSISLRMAPVKNEQQIVWVCLGNPEDYVPKKCRESL